MKKYLIMAFLLLVAFLLVPFPQVKALPDTYRLNLQVAETYVLRGQSFNVTVISNASEVTVRIFDPDGLQVYSKLCTANTSRLIPVQSTAKYGTYMVQANVSDTYVKSLVTVLDISNWSSASLPYTINHKNVQYMFCANGTITAALGNDTLTIDLSTLRTLISTYGLSATVTQNSMNLRVRLAKTGVLTVDLDFAFIHTGCKFIINGTLDQPRVFTFKMENPSSLRTIIDGCRKGQLVFDYSDMRKMQQAFTYNMTTHELSVAIPQIFILDPVIFSDGFESGDTSAWGTESNGVITVVNTTSHTGTWSCQIVVDGWEYASVYKNIGSAYTTVYARMYFKTDRLPANTQTLWVMELTDYADTTYFCRVGIYNEAGTYKVRLCECRPAIVYTLSTGITFAAGTWYCIEYKFFYDDNGEYRVYWEGSEVITRTGLDTNGAGGQPGICNFGPGFPAVSHGASTFTVTIDCCVIDSSYIGVEATNTAPTIASFAAPSTVYANKYEFFNVTVNDADLKTDLRNVTIQLNGSAQFTWLNSTGVFSEASDPSNIFTLDAANSVKTDVNTTAVTLSWKLKPYWNYSEGSVNVNGTVYDAANASGTGSKTGMFTFEDDLIISSVTHLPGQPAAGQQITLTGQIYYEGTATAPEDATGITVYAVRNNTATQVGSTSTFTAGAFSMSWQEGTDGTYGYDVYCVTDEASTQNRTEIIYVEKIITGQLPHDIIPNIPNGNSTDNSGSSDLAPGWVLPVGFNLATPILIFSCLVAIVCYDGYEKDFKLSGTSKSWSKHKGKSRKMGGLFSKRKTDKKTEWKEKKPWD